MNDKSKGNHDHDNQSSALCQPNKRVLVAEDEPISQIVLVEMLNILGLNVDIANNGKEVLFLAKQQAYNIIFMDCNMPVMDGIEATRHLTADSSTYKQHNLKIIAVTANAFTTNKEICLAAGMHDYLTKPYKFEDIKKLVAKHLPA